MKYLAPFSQEGRILNQILQYTNWPTLEFICFHKNWVDIAHFQNYNNWSEYGTEAYKVAQMFCLY
jgi:hypothetical protein